MGLASGYYFKANYYLELWQRKPKTLDQHSIQEAAAAIEQAVILHPNHPHYILTQAKVNEWAWYAGFKTSNQIASNDKLYERAIQLRPTWPVAYADYAYYLGLVEYRTNDAFKNIDLANQFGRYIPEVYMKTIMVGTYMWNKLTVSQKKTTFEAAFLAITANNGSYNNALQIVRDTKTEKQFCIYLKLKAKNTNEITQKRISRDFCSQ